MVSIVRHVQEGARTHGPHSHKAGADRQPGCANPREMVVPLHGVALDFCEGWVLKVDHGGQGRTDAFQHLQQSQHTVDLS